MHTREKYYLVDLKMTSIKLMQHEYEWPIIDINPTAAISFYTVGENDVDAEISNIKKRFHRILRVNPWLTGRLTRERHGGETEVFLMYSEDNVGEKVDDVDTLLCSIIDDDKVFESTDWVTLNDHLSEFKPKKGIDCIDKDEILCRLIVFKSISQSNKLALMFCLNHCIGDGWTFYRLWHMLDKDELVEQLSVERDHTTSEKVERCTNLLQISNSDAGRLLFGKLGRGLKRKLTGRSPPKKFMYRVNKEAIATRKSDFSVDNNFVSTNDILCNWFFGLCEPSHGMTMIVNVRNKIKEVGSFVLMR